MRLAILQLSQKRARGFRFSEITSQHGIDESSLGTKPVSLCQFYGDIHSGMTRNSIQPEDLVKAHAQQVLQEDLLRAVTRLAGNEPIQSGLPTHNTINQFLAKAPIGGRQLRLSQSSLKQVFGMFLVAAAPKHVDRNFSWFFPAHNLK